MSLKSTIYTLLRISNDLSAIAKGPKAVAKRLQRKAVGRITGKVMGRI